MSAAGRTSTQRTANVRAQRIARIYAEALLNAAAKRGATDAVLEELASLINDVFAAAPDLEALLASGAINRLRKAPVIAKLFEHRASETFFHFLMVLNDHERLDLLRPILQACRDLRDQQLGRVRVLIQTAVPMPDDQRDQLLNRIRTASNQEPIYENQVDPTLIGGLILRIGDLLYDHSVRTKLATIRRDLMARSNYEIQSRRDRFRVANGD